MCNSEKYRILHEHLTKMGYTDCDDIPYFILSETCEDLNMNIDDIDISRFENMFGVHIG